MQTQQYTEDQSRNDSILQRNLLRRIRGGGIITYRQLAQELNRPERTIRLAVRDLRRQGHPICSESGQGIKWPESRQDVEKTIAELRSRVADLNETAAALERGSVKLFGQQQVLF